MEKINYPLIYFELDESALLGLLIGTGFQAVERDLRSLKSTLAGYLQKQYKKYDDYPDFDIPEPKLKIVRVPIRPSYRGAAGSFPLSKRVNVPVPLIYGRNNYGYYECYLPLLEQSFYYYDPKQFDSLVQHFATNVFNQMSPEEIIEQCERLVKKR